MSINQKSPKISRANSRPIWVEIFPHYTKTFRLALCNPKITDTEVTMLLDCLGEKKDLTKLELNIAGYFIWSFKENVKLGVPVKPKRQNHSFHRKNYR